MKTFSIVAAAVAATLAGSSAFALAPADDSVAANYDVRLVVSGSSAFKGAFENELSRAGSSVCQTSGSSSYNKYTTQSGGPDLNAYSCLLVPGLISSGGGERAIIYYRGEGGSVYGLAPIARGTPVLRLQVNGSCSTPAAGATGTCTVNGYNPVADTISSGNAVNAAAQLGISDEEPSRFSGENYPDAATASKLQPALTGSERTALNNGATPLVAQSFGVYVNTNDASLNALTSLSRSVIGNIFQGVYNDWNQVPKNDGSNSTVTGGSLPIVVCRREAGSGTQVAASIFFNNQGCGTSVGFVSTANPVNLNSVIENNTTALMRTCISNNPGAIGFLVSEADAAGRKQIKIDGQGGVAGNNLGVVTASGDYSFVFEATAQKASGLSGAPLTVANKLISIAQAQNTGPTAPSVTFLPAFNGANLQFPLNTPAGKQPISCFTRSKNSCLSLQNQC